MNENIIVTLTTWSKRICNIPFVLDSIYAQTIRPDIVVLNLAYGEQIPTKVQEYINSHAIEINRVPDTKVYKKLIPTLRKYPDACVISIDDDWLYPKEMIADFMRMHKMYPNNPISGNTEVYQGIQCHCGCASLTKASYFGDYLTMIDDDLINNCPMDDIVYSFLTTKSGHPYIRTKNLYFTNLEPYNSNNGYSQNTLRNGVDQTELTYLYLTNRFGNIADVTSLYLKDLYISSLLNDIYQKSIIYQTELVRKETRMLTEQEIYSSHSFRLGFFILKPFIFLKRKMLNTQIMQKTFI